ncbi:MAG: Gfo/Idh/MocA family oxidoreductase [Planctomycetia bacterium]|nr:Gfo/Idh/MocA family oxidoreductase [Planctomycetia bacterium]
MNQPHSDSVLPSSSRRSFLKSTTTAAVAGALAAQMPIARSAHAAGSDVLKVGLIGCGGRGSGAAAQAMKADPNVRLTAMGDAFADRLQNSLDAMRKELGDEFDAKVKVPEENRFVGFDAYQNVINSGVDVVILTSPPHFRPAHLAAAVAAGKHVFAEKPVAVDAPGIRSVLATCEEAKKKGLSIVSGLCYRYENAKRETIKRVHDGAVGDVVALHVSYNTNFLWMHPRKETWSDMEWQLRNWLYFAWLSGDHIVEQHVHSLDKAAWAMHDEPPVRASGMGGRQVRTGPEFGHIFDHHAVVFEYANGVKLFSFCRQQDGAARDVSDYVMGTKGTADLMQHSIRSGGDHWKYRGEKTNMYQAEHNELFASIRSGNPINNGLYMSRSSMMAIMGRMATYTGQIITWDQALASQEQLGPGEYRWGDLPVPPVAMPGQTQFA